MFDALLNLFTDTLSPTAVVRWFRRLISFKGRIANSHKISYEEFLNQMSDLPNVLSAISKADKQHNAKILLLVAYPFVNDSKNWQCTAVDKNNRFLFDLKFDVAKAGSFKLDDNEIYSVMLPKTKQ